VGVFNLIFKTSISLNMKNGTLCMTLLLVVLTIPGIFAQVNWCGTQDLDELKAQMLRTREEMRDFVRPRNAVTYVPVRFHLVALTDGTGRATEPQAFKALCILNDNYEDQDIQFYLKEFKYPNNSVIYNNPQSFSAEVAMKSQMKYDAINIFLVNEIGTPGVAAYFKLPMGKNGNDWIVITDEYIADVRVLTHEVGHYFSLNHTFYGWEPDGYDASIHGNPVNFPAINGTPVELVNGSNCTTAGDAICDTPADYLFPSNNCSYTLQVKDKNGDLLAPDVSNHMNYHFGCNAYHFSDDQKTEVNNNLFSNLREYIRPNYTPNTTEITTAPVLQTPLQNELVETYNKVELTWTAVPGADKYLISLKPSGGSVFYLVSNTNSFTLTNLLPNKNYLWAVMGFNEYSTCAPFSIGSRVFKTGGTFTDTSESLDIQGWSVHPNPAKSIGNIFVNVESENGIKLDVSLLTMTGQRVQFFSNHKFAPGLSTLEIETLGMPAGIYLVSLRGEMGTMTKKVAVID
jgi:hypothetical protein